MKQSPKLTDQEKKHVSNYFDASSQDQCIETNTNRIMPHVLRRVMKNSNSHPRTCALTPAETVELKIYSIELKQCSLSHVPYCLNQRQHTD